MDKYIKIIENDEVIKQIRPYLKDIEAYLIGGFVRDMIMNKKSPDRDLIVCNCDIKNFSKNLADKLNAHFIELDNENNIYRIVLNDKVNYLDITKPIENDFEKDIKRRDLTINAIAYDLKNNKFIDLTGGITDIEQKKIKGISDKNFEDDPLRLLRIFRFYSKTGFEIDNSLIEISKKIYKDINKPAKERITVELLKMFEGKYCDLALIKLDECNLLEEIFPIFKEVKKIPPNQHHHLDLLHHSIETVRQIQIIYENASEEIKQYLDEQKYGQVKLISFLKLAGFLHDIGKPACWTIEEETGRHRFIKHDEIGSKLVVPILKELKFSKKQIEYVKTLIKYHIYPSGMVSASDVTEKAYYKFYRKMEGYVIDVIILAMADRLSARGEKITEEMVETNINNLTNLLNIYLEQKNSIQPIEKLLDGRDIMEILQLQQGPKLGQIINALKEAQLSGDVTTKKEAVEFIKSLKL
ncbi:CCA tRNA nucleotidyltransferase [bacterium]|nr:CCA tRNA nucleotidyltransferase [bacterium]